jgi:restriction system protein
MGELTRRRQGEILEAVFRVLEEASDGLQAKEVLARVEQRLALTPFEDSTYPNRPEARRFPKIVRFTTINAVKAGWLIKDKGTWTLTEAGGAALAAHRDPEELMREAVRGYQAWRREQAAGQPGAGDDDALDQVDIAAPTPPRP